MILIVNTPAENPYKKSLDYQKKSTAAEVNYQGTIYCKQITYEKQISLCCRIVRVALCALAAVTLIPLCFSTSLISKWWNQAMSGVDQKVVLIKNRMQTPPPSNIPCADDLEPHVRFQDARARLFAKEDAPAEIADASSFNLENLDSASKSNLTMPQQRKTPPLSFMDTQIAPGKSKHGTTTFFADDVIVENLPILRQTRIDGKLYAFYTQHEKAIIQQQAVRGCTAAVTAMMIMDNGGQVNQNTLLRNLGMEEDLLADLRNAGLHPIVSALGSYFELKALIIKHGSAIVHGSPDGPLGGHVFIVDDVSQGFTAVRIRDPYHGWEITVTSKAFSEAWHGGKVIQISN